MPARLRGAALSGEVDRLRTQVAGSRADTSRRREVTFAERFALH